MAWCWQREIRWCISLFVFVCECGCGCGCVPNFRERKGKQGSGIPGNSRPFSRTCYSAIWVAISGVALIAPVWLISLAVHYLVGGTAWDQAWSTDESCLQLAALLALGLGVAIYNGLVLVFPQAKRPWVCFPSSEEPQTGRVKATSGDDTALLDDDHLRHRPVSALS